MYRRYRARDYELARNLVRKGFSDYEVARRLGFPRSTVQSWRHRSGTPVRGREPVLPERYAPPSPAAYSYLLGFYLGDGTIWRSGRWSARMSLTCDAKYPRIAEEVFAATAVSLPQSAVHRNRRTDAKAIVVTVSSPLLELAFPQAGPGPKHLRRIELAEWQRNVTHVHTGALLRGLIHSDGSRCINRFRTSLPSGRVAEYAYPRYFFSNLSAGIREIFCEHCELLGIRWTQSNERNISVSDRASVRLLDRFVGPKA